MGFDIISVANAKGGAGKTTLTKVLVSAAMATGRDVVVIDSDPSRNLIDWHDRAVETGNWPAGSKGVAVDSFDKIQMIIEKLRASDFDGLVFIDTQGIGSTIHLKIAVNSDFVILPVLLSVDTSITTRDTVDSLIKTIDATPNCKTRVHILRNMIEASKTKGDQKSFDLWGEHDATLDAVLQKYDLLKHWDSEGPLVVKLTAEQKGGKNPNTLQAGLTRRVLQEGVDVINEMFEKAENNE